MAELIQIHEKILSACSVGCWLLSGQGTPTLYTSAKYKTLSEEMSVQACTEPMTPENSRPPREAGGQGLVQDHRLAMPSFSGLETSGYSLSASEPLSPSHKTSL